MFGIAKSEYVDPYSPSLFVQTLVGIGAVQTRGMGSALLDLAALLLSQA